MTLQVGDVIRPRNKEKDERIAVIKRIIETSEGLSLDMKSIFGGGGYTGLCGCPSCVKIYDFEVIAHIEGFEP